MFLALDELYNIEENKILGVYTNVKSDLLYVEDSLYNLILLDDVDTTKVFEIDEETYSLIIERYKLIKLDSLYFDSFYLKLNNPDICFDPSISFESFCKKFVFILNPQLFISCCLNRENIIKILEYGCPEIKDFTIGLLREWNSIIDDDIRLLLEVK